jgi:hypothetical protein
MKTAHLAAQPATRSRKSPPQRPASPHRRAVRCVLLWTCALVLATASPSHLPAVSPAASPQPPAAASLLAVPARTWAVDCANNEALVIQHPGSYLRYRLHVIDEKGDHLRDQIETPEGSVGRTLQRDGRPLTPAEDAAERQRLNNLLASPAAFARHIRNEQNNKQMGVNLLKLIADAMLWSYTPGQPQLPNQPEGDPGLIVLDFKPDPARSPPNFEAEPLTGLEGRLWIDPRTRRMVRLEGSLTHAVNIGWGIVAHLYPGGTVTLQQANVGGQRWIVEHIVEQLNLRAFMVKNVKQRLVFDTADYQPVPPMPYQQAIQVLLDTPLSTH